MKTKKLFVLIEDGGDGSYRATYTLNEDFVKALEARHNSEIFYVGVDGYGFHYDTLNVPEDWTLEWLGIQFDAAVTHAELLQNAEEGV